MAASLHLLPTVPKPPLPPLDSQTYNLFSAHIATMVKYILLRTLMSASESRLLTAGCFALCPIVLSLARSLRTMQDLRRPSGSRRHPVSLPSLFGSLLDHSSGLCWFEAEPLEMVSSSRFRFPPAAAAFISGCSMDLFIVRPHQTTNSFRLIADLLVQPPPRAGQNILLTVLGYIPGEFLQQPRSTPFLSPSLACADPTCALVFVLKSCRPHPRLLVRPTLEGSLSPVVRKSCSLTLLSFPCLSDLSLSVARAGVCVHSRSG